MPRNEWLDRGDTLGGKPCIRRKYPVTENPATYELCLAGKRGEIWQYSETEYSAVIKPGRVQKTVFNLLDSCRRFSNDSEAIVRFKPEMLDTMCKILQVPARRFYQLKYANNF